MTLMRRLISALLLAFALPTVLLAQASVDARLAPGQPPLVIAHLALGSGHPENSLAGIAQAIVDGVDAVYIAVQVTRDGHHVLMHDASLNRTTDVAEVFPEGPSRAPAAAAPGQPRSDRVRDYTLAEIRQLSLTGGRDGTRHPVPTLDEALELIDARVLVILGLKRYDLDGLMSVLDTHETGHLMLFDQAYPPALHEAISARGLHSYASLKDSHDYAGGLDWLAGYAGSELAMVGVYADRLTPEFTALAETLDVRLSLFGLVREDPLLVRGDPSAWLAAMDSAGTAYMTDNYPGVMALLADRP